jgi:hypothetical protein
MFLDGCLEAEHLVIEKTVERHNQLISLKNTRWTNYGHQFNYPYYKVIDRMYTYISTENVDN